MKPSAEAADAPSSEPAGQAEAARLSVRQLARAITRLERGEARLPELLAELGLAPSSAYTVGVTGPPGSGKSTLVDRLTAVARAAGRRVGIIAVDPSSPFSGGALLGDRVRMLRHSGDPGVYIRSMAAGRTLGGLAAASRDVARLLAAAGFDLVLVETVGVGQSELDVVKIADSIVVVAVPGLGDSVQTLKAGLLEIADLFVVNMADRPGVERTVSELQSMLSLAPKAAGWTPPIIETIATEPRGIEELWAALERHRVYLETSGEGAVRRRRRAEAELVDLVEQRLHAMLRRRLQRGPLAEVVAAALDGRLDLHVAAERILADLGLDAER